MTLGRWLAGISQHTHLLIRIDDGKAPHGGAVRIRALVRLHELRDARDQGHEVALCGVEHDAQAKAAAAARAGGLVILPCLREAARDCLPQPQRQAGADNLDADACASSNVVNGCTTGCTLCSRAFTE